jgi:putative flippase GtrA
MKALLLAAPPFLKFAIVGTAGFIVDSAVLVLGLSVFGLDPYSARLFSFLVAITATWIGNRNFTFADRKQKSLFGEWLRFFLANGTGGLINYGTYSLLVAFVPFVNETPVWGVAAGALTAMLFNYVASKHLVFRKP